MAAKPKKAAKTVDPFDVETLRLTPQQVVELTPLQKKAARSSTVVTAKRQPRQQGGFVMMPHHAAKAAYLALGCPQAIVWHYLLYRVWATNNPTVPLPNAALADWGVSRLNKYRALQKLEQAGLIRVEGRPRKSPVVTVLIPLQAP